MNELTEYEGHQTESTNLPHYLMAGFKGLRSTLQCGQHTGKRLNLQPGESLVSTLTSLSIPKLRVASSSLVARSIPLLSTSFQPFFARFRFPGISDFSAKAADTAGAGLKVESKPESEL